MHSAPVQDQDNIADDRSGLQDFAESNSREALRAALSRADVIRVDLSMSAPNRPLIIDLAEEIPGLVPRLSPARWVVRLSPDCTPQTATLLAGLVERLEIWFPHQSGDLPDGGTYASGLPSFRDVASALGNTKLRAVFELARGTTAICPRRCPGGR